MSAWDRMMRQLNETIDRAMLGDPPYGIISAVPATLEPAPPVTIEDIARTMQQIYDAGLRYQPRLEMHYGEGVPDQLLAGIDVRVVPPGQNLDAVYGIPMIPGDCLSPGDWRLVDEYGRIRAFYSAALGTAAVLENPLWLDPPHDRFTRVAREGWGDAESGSLLDRIDAEVEAWERGADAYRYVAELDG